VSQLKPRVRAAAEADAVADTRAVIWAEQAYASANHGLFDDLLRLCSRGPECQGVGIPDYPPDGPDFVDAGLARRSPYRKKHFEREWIANGRPRSLPEGASRTSVLNYCYRATPRGFWVEEAQSFLGEGTGAIVTTFNFMDGCIVSHVPTLGEAIPCPAPACVFPFQ
jgi:hypothetical protein